MFDQGQKYFTYIEYPNKKGLAPIVNNKRTTRVSFAGVFDHSICQGSCEDPHVIHLCEPKSLSMRDMK